MARRERPVAEDRSNTLADGASDRSGLRRALVENELYEHASRLFAEKGFAGTTLADIAAAMGVSRQALYHYVRNKDDLVEKLVRDMIDITRSISDEFIAGSALPPDEKLRGVVRALALHVAERPFRHRLMAQSESVLTGELAAEHATQRRRFAYDVIAIIEDGQRSGVFRPVDSRTAAMSVAGMCNWVAMWFRGDPTTATEVADQIADMALRGLLSRQKELGLDSGPQATIAAIRESLRTLELALDTPDGHPQTRRVARQPAATSARRSPPARR